MNTYEALQEEACRDGIDIVDYSFDSPQIKGLYCNGVIAIRQDIPTQVEKSCILAEELGHHYTTSGNIIDQSKTENRKQEFRARLWAYDRRIGLIGIIKAYKHGCQNRYEIADFLDVTEEFLVAAINAYHGKYGAFKAVDNYT